jgi:hypothetical protein
MDRLAQYGIGYVRSEPANQRMLRRMNPHNPAPPQPERAAALEPWLAHPATSH